MQQPIEPPYDIVKGGMSEDDFYRLADEDSDWEYLDGRIVVHSPASTRHEDLFRFLLTLLSAFLDERGGAAVYGSRFPMRLDANWSPEPDLLVVRDNRRHLITRQRLEGPADLVIEIVSESDPRFEYREKVPKYRMAGVEEIWIIDPSAGEVHVEAKQGTDYAMRVLSAGRLDSIVVPGFWIDVAWLWPERLPSTMQCLRAILR